MSVIIGSAFRAWRACRDEFELYRENAHRQASDACNGRLLNARGLRAGIDSWSLFIGPTIYAYAYASEELTAWWATHPRLTFEQFERAWHDGQSHA